MHQAQAAQAFDQGQFTRVEVVELLIAVHQLGQLRQALVALAAAEHHPQILHCRAHAAVVEVDHVEAVVAAQQVAWMAVAVNADGLIGRGGKQAVQALEQVAGHRLVGRQQTAGDKVAFQQGGQRGVAEVAHRGDFAVFEWLDRGNRMHPPEQAAEAIELVQIARLRRPATTPRKQRETKAGVLEQGFAVTHQWCHHRHFVLGQLEAEAVLLADRRIGPALGAVELGNQRLFVVDADLINAVFVAVQGQHAGVGQIANALDGIQHQVWGQGSKWVAHDRVRAAWGRQCTLALAQLLGLSRPVSACAPGSKRPPVRRRPCAADGRCSRRWRRW